MKTYSAQPKVVAKAGSVSLREARAAARAAKTGHYLRVVNGDAKEVSSLWERYLGHFGGTKKAATRKAKEKSTKKFAMKRVKLAAKKSGAKKKAAKKK